MSTLEGSPNPFGGFVVNPGTLPVKAERDQQVFGFEEA